MLFIKKNEFIVHREDLVIVSSHGGGCDLCKPFDGAILSLTGATEGYTTLDEAEAEGLFHPNCRHTYDLYIDENNPELGIIGEGYEEERKQLEELYPNEKWDWNNGEKASDKSSVYVSPTRAIDEQKRSDIFYSDKEMAMTIARELQRNVYMLPEDNRTKGSKNPDIILNGKTMEMKRVKGSRNRIGINAVNALKQSPNVFIYTQGDLSVKSCLDKIKGEVKVRVKEGTNTKRLFDPNALLYIYTDNKLYKFRWNIVLK